MQCFYCDDYMSHVCYHQAAMPDKVTLRTLLLDQGKDLPVGGEVFAEGRLQWVRELREGLTNGIQ